MTMPFRLKNAEATYKCLVNKIFHELIDRNMEAYVDDLLVKSRIATSLIANLREVFEMLRDS